MEQKDPYVIETLKRLYEKSLDELNLAELRTLRVFINDKQEEKRINQIIEERRAKGER